MAGIEKICEYSGEYPGWAMYVYKRDHIQIMPKYRKEFRGKKAVLYIETSESIMGRYLISFCNDGLAYHMKEADYKDSIVKIGKHRYDLDRGGKSWFPVKVNKEYEYALVVPDMPGDVNGIYVNNSCKMSTVKRKLKRMLRCKKLEVRYIDEIRNLKHIDKSELV